MTTRLLRAPAVVALLCASAARAAAQGTIAAQGFGYPPGQLSARALGTGGSFGLLDPQSGLNPAALGAWGAPGLYVEYAPEFRRITLQGERNRSRIMRFPAASAAVRLGGRGMLGLSATTLLDRTWATQFPDTQVFGVDTLAFISRSSSQGAINDIRLAVAWALARSFQVGVGAHAITGENRRFLGIEPVNCPRCDSLAAPSRVSYGGVALSAGLVWQPLRQVTLGAAGRKGGRLTTYVDDTARTRADVPDQVGLALRYEGITGASIAASWRWDGWSRMNGLGSESVHVSDTYDVGVGVELQGPRFAGAALPVRAGFRWRTLPFGVDTSTVRETAFAAGVGVPLAQNRAALDLTVQTARRDAGGLARELGWTVGVGLFIRP